MVGYLAARTKDGAQDKGVFHAMPSSLTAHRNRQGLERFPADTHRTQVRRVALREMRAAWHLI